MRDNGNEGRAAPGAVKFYPFLGVALGANILGKVVGLLGGVPQVSRRLGLGNRVGPNRVRYLDNRKAQNPRNPYNNENTFKQFNLSSLNYTTMENGSKRAFRLIREGLRNRYESTAAPRYGKFSP